MQWMYVILYVDTATWFFFFFIFLLYLRAYYYTFDSKICRKVWAQRNLSYVHTFHYPFISWLVPCIYRLSVVLYCRLSICFSTLNLTIDFFFSFFILINFIRVLCKWGCECWCNGNFGHKNNNKKTFLNIHFGLNLLICLCVYDDFLYVSYYRLKQCHWTIRMHKNLRKNHGDWQV